MSKKNIALVLIIVCLLTIMMVGVFGNSTVTGTKTNVEEVFFLKEDGQVIEKNSDDMFILSLEYTRNDLIDIINSDDGNTYKIYKILFYGVVSPLNSSYPKLFIDIDNLSSGIKLIKEENPINWPFSLNEDDKPLGIIYKYTLEIDSSIIRNGSVSLTTRIDEHNNTTKVIIPTLNISWEYIKSEEEIIEDSEDLE